MRRVSTRSQLHEYFAAQKLVPAGMQLQLLLRALHESRGPHVLCGFPRTPARRLV